MTIRHSHRLTVAIAVLTFAIVLILMGMQWLSMPVSLVDAPSARVACLSYAPFRRPGETPFDPDARVPIERLRADLQILRSHTDCVRTYSVSQGLEAVPAIAGELGMRVLLGIWIGRDAAQNQREIARAIEIAQAHAADIDAIVVGNEVLLRREQTAADLARLIRSVQEAMPVPVTYADVWEFWLQNAQLADAVDFVTIHVLPFWEDDPVGVAQAVEHVRATLAGVQEAFPRHEVFLGETGWPSAGRMRGPARPGPVEQARFFREWTALAGPAGIRYNLIEAFDQPWKRALEGAMGGHWGIFDSSGQAKFPWRGPVSATSGVWSRVLPAGALCAGLALLLALAARRPAAAATMGGRKFVFAALSAGLVAGLLLPLQWDYLQLWNRSALEWAGSGLFTLAGCLGLLTLTPLLVQADTLPGVAAWSRLRGRQGDRDSDPLFTFWVGLRATLLFGCALFVLLHVFDPRYRGYANVLYAPPAIVLLILWVAGPRVPADALHERVLGLVILAGLPLMLWPELPHNTQALGFSLLAAVIGASAVWAGRGAPRSPSSPSSAPNKPGSTA